MVNTDTERYVRLTLLMFEGGTLISKEILIREISKSPGLRLSALLNTNKRAIKQKHKHKDISGKHYLLVKQTIEDETALHNCDVQLLVKMILFLFGSTISGQEKSDLNDILSITNDLICHKSQPRIDKQTYVASWTKLTECLNRLSSGVEAATSQRISQIIDDLSRGPLDLESSILKVAELFRNDEHIENVLAALSRIDKSQLEITTAVATANKGVATANEKLDDLLAMVGQQMKISDKEQRKVEIPVLQSEVCITCKYEENAKLLEDIILTVTNAAKNDPNVDQADHKSVFDAVSKLLDDFESMGLKAVSAEKGSLLLHIRCSNLQGLFNLLSMCRNNGRLVAIEQAMNELFHEDTRVEFVLTEDSIVLITEWIGMATGGELSQSVLHASDEVVERPCGICSTKDNKDVESIKYCVHCHCNFCKSCTKWHDNFPIMSGHQVVDISMTTGPGQPRAPSLPTERCENHHDKLLDTYCPIHDQLCCVSCVNTNHGQCKNLQYIPHVAQGVKEGKEYRSITRSMEDIINQLEMVKSHRLDVLQKLDEAEPGSQKSVQDLRKRLIQLIEDMTETESEKIKSRYQEVRDAVGRDIKAVEVQLDATETCKKKLNDFQDDNESELFVYMKQGEKNVKNGRSLINTLKGSNQTCIPKYIINNSIEKYLSVVKSLGEFESTVNVKSLGEFERAVKLTLESEYNVKTAGDSYVCDITGLCVLPDGSVILADCFNNRCLKQLDHSYRVTSSLDMSALPSDVCYTNCNNEVAVALWERKVQFVRVGAAMEQTRSFSVDGACRSICCSQGELFVCYVGDKGHKVCVFTLAGQAVRTIQYDQAGQPLFSIIWYITVSSNGSKLHVTDRDKDVITLDRTGNLLSTYTEPGLDARGICTLDDDDLLVTDYENNTVLHVSSDGKKLGVVLRKQDGIESPWAVCYDSVSNKVIVSTRDSDTIKVYKLQ